MDWQLCHGLFGLTCSIDRKGRLGVRRKRRDCPHDGGLGVGEALAAAITSILDAKGLGCSPVGGGNRWLWCLGGTELYRYPPVGSENMACVDLSLWVCDHHRAITVSLDHFDLLPESISSHSLGEPPVPAVLDRLDPWLGEVLALER